MHVTYVHSHSFCVAAIPEDAISDSEPHEDNPNERISREYWVLGKMLSIRSRQLYNNVM